MCLHPNKNDPHQPDCESEWSTQSEKMTVALDYSGNGDGMMTSS